jgi:hypothetical protein
MQVNRTGFRQLLESHNGDLRAFEHHIWHLAGLTDERGVQHYSATGQPVLRNPIANGREVPRLRLGEVSLRGLAEAIMGEDAVQQMNPERSGRAIRERTLMESGTGAVHPSAFSNISTFNGIATGLLEAQILEGYQNPKFIGDKLAKPSPTRYMNGGRKTIGVGGVGDKGEPRQPGMPTKRVSVNERWLVQPETVENSLSMELLQETVWNDLTGQMVERANGIGESLLYRKEIRIIDAFAGVTNTYNYKGNPYNTYISNGYYNNALSGNPLLTPENLNTAQILFREMKDPETGLRIYVEPNMLICQQEYYASAVAITQGQTLQYRDKPSDSASAIQRYVNGPSVYAEANITVEKSALLYDRIVAADGLNQSASNAAKYWWLIDANGFMTYEEYMPLRVQSAAPGNADMIDRGVLLFVHAAERGVPMIKEPRKAVRCTG